MDARPAGWNDFDAVCALLSTRSRAVHGVSEVRPEHVRADWELPSFEVGRDNWVALEEDRLTGYAAVIPTCELELACVDAATGEALLALAVAGARALALDAIRIFVPGTDERLLALVDQYGFERETEILRMWKMLDGSDPD